MTTRRAESSVIRNSPARKLTWREKLGNWLFPLRPMNTPDCQGFTPAGNFTAQEKIHVPLKDRLRLLFSGYVCVTTLISVEHAVSWGQAAAAVSFSTMPPPSLRTQLNKKT